MRKSKNCLHCSMDHIDDNGRSLQFQGPHSHILMTGGGPSDFFGSEILAKSNFFGSMKDAGTVLGREK